MTMCFSSNAPKCEYKLWNIYPTLLLSQADYSKTEEGICGSLSLAYLEERKKNSGEISDIAKKIKELLGSKTFIKAALAYSDCNVKDMLSFQSISPQKSISCISDKILSEMGQSDPQYGMIEILTPFCDSHCIACWISSPPKKTEIYDPNIGIIDISFNPNHFFPELFSKYESTSCNLYLL